MLARPLHRTFWLIALFVLVFGSGCAAATEEDADTSEDEINRFFDGPVVRKLINLSNEVDAAAGAKASDKDRLVKELSTFGAALTKNQQTAYVSAYGRLERVTSNERRYVAASRALHDFMISPEGGGALQAAAPRTSSAAEGLFEGFKKLATTPYALPAASFAARMLDRRNQSDPVVRSVSRYAWEAEVLTPAITHGAGQALAEAEGDREGALSILTEKLGVLAYATQDRTEVYAGWTALVTTWRTKDMKAFGRLESRLLKTPVVGAFMSVGVLFNLMAAGGDIQNGEIGQETLATLGDAAQQLSRALVSVSEAGLIGRFGGTAIATFSKFIERITPGLGILCTTASLRNHIEKTGSDGAIGAYIGAVGDVIALTGVLAESFGVTAPLGAIITGLGFTISFLGDVIQDWLAEAAIKAEEKQLLRTAGVETAVADVLVDVNAKHLQGWAADLRFDAAKLQWIAKNAPDMLTAGWLSGFKVDGFERLVRDLRYTDGGWALLQSVYERPSGSINTSYDFVRDIGGWSFTGQDLRGQWLRAVQGQVASGPQEHTRAFTRAAAFISTH